MPFRLVVGGSRNDERGARFVEQDRIDLVNDGEIEGALHHLPALIFHIVAQIIEAKFVIGRIRDVGGISLSPLILAQVRHDHAGGKPTEAIDQPHPVTVATGELIVHRSEERRVGSESVSTGRSRWWPSHEQKINIYIL